MTNWQWRVILALCRIVIHHLIDNRFHYSSDDTNMLYMAIQRGELE
jgi:hypothetical protein